MLTRRVIYNDNKDAKTIKYNAENIAGGDEQWYP